MVTIRQIDPDNQFFESAKEQLDNFGVIFASQNTPGYPPTFQETFPLYGVFVDEDIYPNDPPVYTFQFLRSMRNRPKVFITANGIGKDAWSVHIVHPIAEILDPFGFSYYFYRFVTIDNDTSQLAVDNPIPSQKSYILDTSDICNVQIKSYREANISSIQYPGFARFFSISNFVYGGGGYGLLML
ncbi:MAG: hypothetical protein CV045_08460 [Cyanobacteria bacterium M5B4]|nr:MAG: hypothetical protein CV045_08460 [Cyanobacteria bacterium M5B4]